MEDLDALIAYENEHTFLDFKAIQYTKDKHKDLLKDIIAMANVPGNRDRFIVIGLNHKSSGNRDFIGILGDEFIDAAIYQQLADENIEPELHIEYFSHEYDEHLFGILKISNCDDKPYMMKKAYDNLKRGSSFIRKGTTQAPLMRADIDKIFSERINAYDISEHVEIGFKHDELKKQIQLPHLPQIELPSDKARSRIKEVLKKKKQEEDNRSHRNTIGIAKVNLGLNQSKFSGIFRDIYGKKPLNDYTIKQLEEILETVREDYSDEDYYEVMEIKSNKIDFTVFNNSKEYLEDVSYSVEFKKLKGLLIAEKKPSKPMSNDLYAALNTSANFYPNVEISNEMFTITGHVGDIKHHIPTDLFSVPLRVSISPELLGEEIDIKISLYAKNIAKPIIETLKVEVVLP